MVRMIDYLHLILEFLTLMVLAMSCGINTFIDTRNKYINVIRRLQPPLPPIVKYSLLEGVKQVLRGTKNLLINELADFYIAFVRTDKLNSLD